jgi:hypothetical protein
MHGTLRICFEDIVIAEEKILSGKPLTFWTTVLKNNPDTEASGS